MTRTDMADRVAADPRVKAALAAFDAFRSSPGGRTVDAALNTRTHDRLGGVDWDLQSRWLAHSYNYHATRTLVRAELRGTT